MKGAVAIAILPDLDEKPIMLKGGGEVDVSAKQKEMMTEK